MTSILKNSNSIDQKLSVLEGPDDDQQQRPIGPILTLDATTAKLMYQTSQQTSSYIQQIANEPTIGLFHVQDHIRRNIPKNVELKKNIKALGDRIEEKSFDIDYSIKTVKSFTEIQTFSNISTMLQSSIDKANKLVNNKSLLFINSQIAPPSSSKTFSSFQQQHKIYQQNLVSEKNNNNSNSNLNLKNFNDDDDIDDNKNQTQSTQPTQDTSIKENKNDNENVENKEKEEEKENI